MTERDCLTDCGIQTRPGMTGTAFGCPRNFLDNRFVYVVISARARGLSVGINVTPAKDCNFNCLYCEVDRQSPPFEHSLDLQVMATELDRTLRLISSGGIRAYCPYTTLSDDLLRLRHVAFSGDGEPTLCPQFAEAVQKVVHVRALHASPFFKLVLLTNGSSLDAAPVREGLRYFTGDDEVWVKLDAGSQLYMDRINRSNTDLEKVVQNAILIGRERPIVIQSLFPLINLEGPCMEEIDEYIRRINEIKASGARISLIQIYSATRPVRHPECTHMPLKDLTSIRNRVQAETGLTAEVF